jgi:hypothetical protein
LGDFLTLCNYCAQDKKKFVQSCHSAEGKTAETGLITVQSTNGGINGYIMALKIVLGPKNERDFTIARFFRRVILRVTRSIELFNLPSCFFKITEGAQILATFDQW